MSIEAACPVLGFIAPSGTGKTSLLRKIIPLLRGRHYQVGVIKHSHHDFEIDQPGKDSHALRKAGARQTLLASSYRWALITETPEQPSDPSLQYLLTQLDTHQLDIVLVEGFKQEHFPKIELARQVLQQPFLYPDDPDVIAVATDQFVTLPDHLTRLDINNPLAIADFIEDFVRSRR